MGSFDKLFSNTSEVENSFVTEKLALIIGNTLRIQHVFKFIRDKCVFIDKHLTLIKKQRIIARKVDYHLTRLPLQYSI